MIISDINELAAELGGALDRDTNRIVLTRYVAPVIEKILEKHVEEDIYGVDPRGPHSWYGGLYPRRHNIAKNIKSEIDGNGVLHVTSTEEANAPARGWHSSGPGGFLELFEVGNMGFLKRHGKSFPRPAVTRAQKEVDSSPEVRAAVELGLREVLGE